jgi:hypothetical protein
MSRDPDTRRYVDGVRDGLEVGSAEVGAGFIDYLPTGGLSPWANASIQGQKSIPLPSFTRSGSDPKVDQSDIDWTTASVSDPNEIHWPSVISTAQVSGAAADYHCYFAPHNSDGVGLAHFDDPDGKWTLKDSPAIDGGAGESGAFVRPDGEVWLYSNRPNDDVHLWRSPNGVDTWTDDGTVYEGEDVANGGHAGYARPMQVNGSVYTYSFWKPREDHSRAALHYSESGTGNFTHVGVHWLNRQDPTGTTDVNWNHPSLVPFFGGWLAFYASKDATGSDPTGEIRMGWTSNGIHIRDLGVALGSENSPSWEQSPSGTFLSDPQAFWGPRGKLHLVYAGGQSANPSYHSSIGLATADFAEVRA